MLLVVCFQLLQIYYYERLVVCFTNLFEGSLSQQGHEKRGTSKPTLLKHSKTRKYPNNWLKHHSGKIRHMHGAI